MRSITIHENVICPMDGRFREAHDCFDCAHGNGRHGHEIDCSFIAHEIPAILDAEAIQARNRRIRVLLGEIKVLDEDFNRDAHRLVLAWKKMMES